MMLNTVSLSVFGISVTDGEFFSELSVRDKVSLMGFILLVNHERCVGHPLTGFVNPITFDAAGTAHIRKDTAGCEGK